MIHNQVDDESDIILSSQETKKSSPPLVYSSPLGPSIPEEFEPELNRPVVVTVIRSPKLLI